MATGKVATKFLLLGDFAVENGTAIQLGGPKQRALLAYLLLNERRIVSVDQLVEAVWGERAPPTAAAIVHSYVRKLRGALGETGARIETRSPGYTLELNGAEVDACTFEQLVAEGREALRAGDVATGRERLNEALGFWRGRALGDLADIPGIAEEAQRLDQLRLEATEERIDADLEIGRHREVVGELERLAREHPYRERLRGQLMRALYLSGNQAAALDQYRATRKFLADELGIEPGRELQQFERAILNQDPALAPAHVAEEEPTHERAWRVPRRVAIAGIVLLAVVAAGIAVLATRGAGSVAVHANSVAVVDPHDGRVAFDIPVGADPVAVATGKGGIWVANSGDATLTRIDPRAKRSQTVGLATPPNAVAVGPAGAWAISDYSVTHVLPTAAGVINTTPLPHGVSGGSVGRGGVGIAVGDRAVWVASADFQLVRLDPSSGDIVHTYDLDNPVGPLAVGAGSVWTASGAKVVTRFDPAQGIATATIDLGATVGTQRSEAAIAYGFGAAWVLITAEQTLWRVDAATNDATAVTHVPAGATGVAAGAGAVWVTSSARGKLSRVDPASGKITKTIGLGHSPSGVAAYGDTAWVTVR